MKKLYHAPHVTEYGHIVARTRYFGGPSAGDVILDADGNPDLEGFNSIDGCAESGGKCICADNGTC